MTGFSQLELVKPKAKRRRKALFTTRKQRRASRMRQQKQEYDSLNNTMKALEFSPDRTRSRTRIRRSEALSVEDTARKGGGVRTTRGVEFPKAHDLSRISETQV